MPGDIHSMKHWKLSKMPTPESPPVIFQAKPCARTGRKKTAESNQHEYWEIIADNLSKAGSTQDASQLWIQTPEQSSSPTRMVATGNLETINSSQQEQLSNN
jgi:hypothetical protein